MPAMSRALKFAALVAVIAVNLLPSVPAQAFGTSASTWGAGRLDAFVRGTDGALWHRWRDQGVWHWESLGGLPTSDASAVSWSSGRIDVFSRGLGGTLWHRWLNNGTWYGWESLGGQLAAQPAAISLAPGTLDVLVQGTDAALWRANYDASGWHWSNLGGRLASAPSVASASAGRIDVFVEGADAALWHDTLSGGTSSWESVGGRLGSGPSAVLWHWNNGAWEGLGGSIAYTMSAVSAAPGTLDVFAQTTGRTLWHRGWSGSWAGWEDGGGVLVTPSDPVTLPVPVYRQDYGLDCETAAMQMALTALGHYYTQAYLLSFENADTRPPIMGANKHVIQWGDPYTNFVGDVNGNDSTPTGYGIYFPLIASIARSHGDPFAHGGEGYAAGTVYAAVAAGHPVEVWVETGWGRPYVGTWTAWDGRPIRYSLAEHTVVITGVSPGSVRVNDSWRNAIYWVSKSTFQTSWADFNNMAVFY